MHRKYANRLAGADLVRFRGRMRQLTYIFSTYRQLAGDVVRGKRAAGTILGSTLT